jgi:hypothetical protein
MARSNRKKTDIPIPEPRHRVGPRGVSSGISFRELPPPSLDEIKKICEHYQVKCAGTYKSLASRYVYQMATEIEDLVDTLKGESGSSSIESSFLPSKKKFSRVKNANVDVDAARKVGRFHDKRLKKTAKTARHVIDSPKEMRSIGSSSEDTTHEPVRYRNVANTRKPRRSRHASTETDERREFHFDFSLDDEPHLPFNKHYVYSDDESSTDKYISTHQRRNADPLTRRNLEDQNEEVLRWLKEEMERSQSLIQRSKRMHDVEIDNAKQELEKVKKAAKSIIKAVHKKGMERAAKSEANAESERRRRVKSQRLVQSLIKSHSEQVDQIKKGLRHTSRRPTRDEMFYTLGDCHKSSGFAKNEPRDVYSLLGDCDLTSVLDDLAEEAFQQSC